MKVAFYATLRPIVGGKTVDFAVDGGLSARQLLDIILVNYPGLRPELVDADGQLLPHVHFFINGRDVQFLEGAWNTQIRAEDVVSVFPAVGGG